jgi:hypothetical protein
MGTEKTYYMPELPASKWDLLQNIFHITKGTAVIYIFTLEW